MADKNKSNAKKPKKQSKETILEGLKAGKRYQRQLEPLPGGFERVEKLIPSGPGPSYTTAQYICEITGGGQPEKTNEGFETIDDLGDLIGSAKNWTEF